MFKIHGWVQNSDWGDLDAIPRIVGLEPTGEPQAEYWLGAHVNAPSTVDGDEATPLDALIAADPMTMMGTGTAEQFGQLPFLLKILAAAKPLSIQAHPSIEQAKRGFARENDAGLELTARNRSYRDPNHKPEMICALTPFEAKCGLRPVAEVLDLLGLFESDHVAEWRRILNEDPAEGDAASLRRAVSWLLTLDATSASALVGDVVSETRRLIDDAGVEAGRFFSELTWTVQIDRSFPGDIGVAVALMLNHVTLQPGEAMFLEAGNLHAYLCGVGIELMASSDNVLRGGLTSKHIDVNELLSVVSYEPMRPPVQRPESGTHRFAVPVPEFSLTRIVGPGFRPEDGPPDEPVTIDFNATGPEIVLVTDGLVELDAGGQARGSEHLGADRLTLNGGEAAFIPAAQGPYRLTMAAPRTLVWRAGTGSAR